MHLGRRKAWKWAGKKTQHNEIAKKGHFEMATELLGSRGFGALDTEMCTGTERRLLFLSKTTETLSTAWMALKRSPSRVFHPALALWGTRWETVHPPQKSPPLAARPPLRSPTVLLRRSPSVVSYELALAGAGGRPSPTAEAGGGALSNLTERRLGSGGRVETRRCGLSSGAVPVHRYWPECLLDDAHTPKHMSVQGAGRGFAAGL